jgi:pyruvate,water dikinase
MFEFFKKKREVSSHKDNARILWFNEISNEDVKYVGGKNASLGEMYRQLSKQGVRVPNGFAITANAYRYIIKEAGIEDNIKKILKSTDTKNVRSLSIAGTKIRDLIRNATIPQDLREEIIKSYHKLCKLEGSQDVAVRSSATAEDLPTASFAGQQETYLNISGENALIDACKKCFASLFTDRAISYREDKKFDHFKVYLSIGIQKMVRSDQAASGVMFTLDTDSGFKDVVYITSIYGLGENIVQGKVNPDEYYVFKPTLAKGFRPILTKKVGSKDLKMVYHIGGNKTTKDVNVPLEDRKKFVLTDDEVMILAKWGVIIEDHYKKPMDIEWAKDGKTNQLYIVQARPETVQSQKNWNILEEYKLKGSGKPIVTGIAVGSKIGEGKVKVIKDAHEIQKFNKGEVLVTEMTDPDWEPIMKVASAIVTNKGGRTCHAAIVSREMGVPCVVGCGNATAILKDGQKVTVSCAEGEAGKVYNGFLGFKVDKHDLAHLKKPSTKIMMNLGEPEQAFTFSFIPNDGIGLAREEFIINSFIKIHPMALLNYHNIKDHEVKKQIDELTYGYKDKSQYFVDKLASGISMLSAAFYPKDVIVRFSDFKTNEYANLIGGKDYEPNEDNPMIGWRGASRYYDPKYRDAFALECKAIKKVREEMGLTNLKVMIPFCRTIEEGKSVIEEMKKNSLVQGKNGLQVYVMCEIPSNVILAEEFCKIFDGFSIGSNDLTQLTLGLDRDSELVSHIYSERNEAVKRLIKQVITVAKKHHRKIGICGDAPSSFPDFAKFLVDCGIDSISLSPDAVLKTILALKK